MPAKKSVKPIVDGTDLNDAAAKEAKGSGAKPEKRRTRDEKAVVLKSKTSYRGKVFSVTTDTVIEPGGVKSKRDVIRHNGSVVVLAVDASKDAADPSVVLIRQYRHAAGQFLFEIPAGRIEPGEAPLAAAKRELMEETGVKAKRWSKLANYYASPGFLAETMQIYLAEQLTFGVATPEDDEKIELLHVPLSELQQWVQSGKIIDGKTMIGILSFAQKRS